MAVNLKPGTDEELLALARQIDPARYAPWPPPGKFSSSPGARDDLGRGGVARRILAALLFVILVAALTFVLVTRAEAYCSEPSAPSCASRYSDFDDEYEFDRCKRQMDSYRDEVESFISCVVEEANRKRRTALDEYNDAVRSFNRRARGF